MGSDRGEGYELELGTGGGQGDVVYEVISSHQWDEINAFCRIVFLDVFVLACSLAQLAGNEQAGKAPGST